MELSWLMRLRIVAAMAVGVVLLGILPSGLVTPPDPEGAITIFNGAISVTDIIICLGLAFLAGFIAFFVSYPYGCEIGVFAAPAGLCAWVLTSGDMFSLLIINNTLTARLELYKIMQYEGVVWLAVVAAGYVGVHAARKLIKFKPPHIEIHSDPAPKANNPVNIAISMLLTVVIAYFVIQVLAQDVRYGDERVKSVVGQPGVGQIGFAVLVSFGLSAFVAKRYLDVSYMFCVIASALMVFVSIGLVASKSGVIEYMIETWPTAFYPNSICAVLPLQMVSFAAIGAIIGYWIAVKMLYHKKHG